MNQIDYLIGLEPYLSEPPISSSVQEVPPSGDAILGSETVVQSRADYAW